MKKRKAEKQLKKMRKAGVRAWKKKKKKGKMLAFCNLTEYLTKRTF